MPNDFEKDAATEERRARVRAIAEKRRAEMEKVKQDFAVSSRRKREAVKRISDDVLREAVAG